MYFTSFMQFDRLASNHAMPRDIPLVDTDDSEDFEETKNYVSSQLGKDEKRICERAND